MSQNLGGMNANTTPVVQNQHGHFLQSPFLCSQIPSVLIPNNSWQSAQYFSPPPGIFPNGRPSLNLLHVLPSSPAIGASNNGNFMPADLRAQGSCVEQSQVLIGSPPGITTTPSPFYQNLSSIQRNGRTTHEPISTLNQDQLTVENHLGFATGPQQRAQGRSSILRILYHSPSTWLATGMNSQCQTSDSQTEHSFNTPAHQLRELDLEPGYPISFHRRSPPCNTNGSLPTYSQQQRLDFRGHRQSQEEKHGQAENGQDPTSTSDLRHVPEFWIGSLEEKNAGFEKHEKNKKQKVWSRLYGFKSPLHYAIQMNDGNKVRWLLKTCNPNRYHSETGETAMHLACRLGKLQIVKLLRRHPTINMKLKTTSGTKASYSPAGYNAVQIANHFRKLDVVNFLDHFKPRDPKRYAEMSSPEYELKIEHGVIKQRLDKLRPEIDALTKENEELKKKLKELESGDAHIMGIKLPRKKPMDMKKHAEVLKIVRQLERDLSARQQRMWAEREDEKLCTICLERQKDIVLVPCGHLFCCVCSSKFGANCPNCRKQIERRITTYS